jgi:IS30 family transposase
MHKQLTAADRKAIEVLLSEQYTVSSIASKLGVDKSTICREITNRSTPAGYLASIAQINYEVKHKNTGRKRKLKYSHTQNYVLEKIMFGWSPEQIAGRMKLENRTDCVCMETIYNWIYTDPLCKQDKIYQYLRLAKKRRTIHHARKTKSLKILNKISIHQRPAIVRTKTEYGHWEGDSVIYTNKQAINTLNELMTGIVRFTKLDQKTASLTSMAMVSTLSKEAAKTLTLDNGTEFMNHEHITQHTGTSIYFCDPYSSYQRGSNENSNGLLRRYLPKKSNIQALTQEELDDIAWELNHRPRKRLGYLSPIEFYQLNVLNLPKESLVAFDSRI